MGGGSETGGSPHALPQRTTGPVGKQIHNIYKDRLRQFTDNGQYAGQNLQSKLYEGRATGKDYVKLSVYSPPDLTRPPFEEATKHDFRDTQVGQKFGPSWSTHWFKVELTVPKELRHKKHLELHWDANNEGLVWTKDGEPLQGLTGGGERIEWIIPHAMRDGNTHTIYIEMACNGMFGNAPGGDSIQPPDPNKYFTLSTADIVAVNEQARQLYIDFWILGDAAREFPDDSWEEREALKLGNQIIDTFEMTDEGIDEAIAACRKIAAQFLGDVTSAKVYKTDKEPLVYAIGHCHIDTCWLWPFDETKRKVARSWANQCDLMDRYPEHRFACSQAQQYKWLEQYYPKLFDRVKGKIKEGRFQPVGGSWVEHDTNMPSGESLVRQFLYGQRFFESRFGQRCRTFWLPDTFGYSAQLPQISRLAGMNRFFTQKISWNNINDFPHTTFRWVGIDNSQVLCHMAPANTYTAEANFGDVNRSLIQNKSMDQDPHGLLVFGKGDGGGGPTWEHLEKLRRCRGISDKTGRLPRVHMGESVEDFYDKLEQKVADGTNFVTWYGELYLELHRGTYTTQANNKRNNRRVEVMLHDVEFVATMASLKDKSYKYPKKEIDDIWENILLCQFHDCLPGSSIEMCYRDSDRIYADAFRSGLKLTEDAMKTLGFDVPFIFQHDVPTYAINTLPWFRAEILKMEIPKRDLQGRITHDDKYYLLEGGSSLMDFQEMTEEHFETRASIAEVGQGVFEMSNGEFKLRVRNGVILSLVDLKAKREVLIPGKAANQLVLYDDKPLYWQAWDVEVYHLDTRRELEGGTSRIVEAGPYRVCLETLTPISKDSWIKTQIKLNASFGVFEEDRGYKSYIEVSSEIEWRETMKFLKVEFPVDIVNTEACYETQFGYLKRPTHYNNSWDMAKFEVCSHKWADLSEYGYGVSILNDSKYGFAVAGDTMRLSLLRASKAPDAHADMGRHHVRWAIFPHAGGLGFETVKVARNFNSRPIPVSASALTGLPAEDKLLRKGFVPEIRILGHDSLILDTIKRGEDDEDVSRGDLPVRLGKSIVLRIYESLGGHARGQVRWDTMLNASAVYRTNLLEDDEEEIAIRQFGFAIALKPFEVATFRVQLE